MNDPTPPKSPAKALSRDQLIEQHIDLVSKIARNIALRLPRSFDFEDLRSCGFVGLVQAADRWDSTRGVPFKYYAGRRIRGEILENVRRRHWTANTMYEITPEILEIPGETETSIEAPIDISAKRRLIEAAKAGLDTRERVTCEIYYEREGKLTDISLHFGVSQNKSSAMLQSVKRSMRRELGYRGMKKAA